MYVYVVYLSLPYWLSIITLRTGYSYPSWLRSSVVWLPFKYNVFIYSICIYVFARFDNRRVTPRYRECHVLLILVHLIVVSLRLEDVSKESVGRFV